MGLCPKRTTLYFSMDLDKGTDPGMLSNFVYHCTIFNIIFIFSGNNAYNKIRHIKGIVWVF